MYSHLLWYLTDLNMFKLKSRNNSNLKTTLISILGRSIRQHRRPELLYRKQTTVGGQQPKQTASPITSVTCTSPTPTKSHVRRTIRQSDMQTMQTVTKKYRWTTSNIRYVCATPLWTHVTEVVSPRLQYLKPRIPRSIRREAKTTKRPF
jgi:hypothetical protein